MTAFYNDMGGRIAKLRRENHLTQPELAEMLDISVKHCSAVERGLSNLSLDRLCLLCDIFGTTMDYLVRGIGEKSMVQIPSYIIDTLNSNDCDKKSLLMDYLKMYQKLTQSNKTEKK